MGVSLAEGAGIAKGLAQGVQAYLQTQNMLQEQAIKKKLANAQSVDAYAKLISEGGTDIADVNAQALGLLPSGNNQPQPVGLVQDQSGAKPQNGVALASFSPQPQGGAPGEQNAPVDVMNAVKQSMRLPKNARGLILDPVKKQIDAEAELKTTQGKTNQDQREASLKNTKNESYVQFRDRYNQDKLTDKTRSAAIAVDQLFKVGNSPAAQQELVYKFLNIVQPGELATEGKLEDARKVPQIMQKYGDLVNQALTGSLTQTTVNDIKRTGGSAFLSLLNQHKDLRDKTRAELSSKGIDSSFLNEPTLDKLQKTVSMQMKKMGEYKNPAAQLAETAPGKAVATGAEGLLQGAKGLMANLIPGDSLARQNASEEAGPQGKSVVQDGTRFIWDPKTKEYKPQKNR